MNNEEFVKAFKDFEEIFSELVLLSDGMKELDKSYLPLWEADRKKLAERYKVQRALVFKAAGMAQEEELVHNW